MTQGVDIYNLIIKLKKTTILSGDENDDKVSTDNSGQLIFAAAAAGAATNSTIIRTAFSVGTVGTPVDGSTNGR